MHSSRKLNARRWPCFACRVCQRELRYTPDLEDTEKLWIFNFFPGCKARGVSIATWHPSCKFREGMWEGNPMSGCSGRALSGCFLALFSLPSSNLVAVSALRGSAGREPRSWASSFLQCAAGGCSSCGAEPAVTGHGGGDGVVTGICCRVPFAAGQELIWGF